MEDVVEDVARPGRTYAEPLSGLRVSWGSILAGTAALLAVALILWLLALSVVALATHPAAGSLRGSAVALWICAMAVTLVGAFVGGLLAGYLPGNRRAFVGAAHGFLAWCVALLLAFGAQMVLLRGVVATATGAALDVAAAQGPTFGTPGEGTSPTPGPGAAAGPTMTHAQATTAGRAALNAVVGLGWSWFGTWAIAGALAVLGGAAGARRIASSEDRGPVLRERERERFVQPGAPVTPAHSA